MKSRLLPVYMLAVLSLVGTYSFGRALIVNGQPQQQPSSHASYKTEAGDCTRPVAQFDMDVNNVRARLLSGGDMWWDGVSYAQYEVPKGNKSSGQSYPQALYAGAIWVSGFDQGNNLKIAALTYRNTGTDFWPGPLDANVATISKGTCDLWDRHFPVWATQIKPVINAYQAAIAAGGTPGNINIPLTSISDSIKFWPGKGNPYLAALGYNVADILAPFYDADGDGNYNPAKGDYPTIKQGGISPSINSSSNYCGDSKTDSLTYVKNNAYADEMVFWVTNDKGGPHEGTSGGVPIGIQVNNLAFAFVSGDEINSMTFYTYNIINKSGSVLNNSVMSQYVDPDLGCPNNDRVGCDTSRNLGIVYNGVPQGALNTLGYSYVCDQGVYCNQGTIGYGCNLPMLGIDFFEGPTDTARIPDPSNPGHFTHKQLGLSAFASYTNGSCATCDPATAIEFRRYQTGFWKDGTHITYGGDGYQKSSINTNFMYPGDPSIASQWSECNPQIGTVIGAADRRFVQSSGPFTFLPCASQSITVGVVFIQPEGGVGSNCPSFGLLRTADDKAQALFDAGFKPLVGPSAPLLTIRELDKKVIINVTSDPQGNNIGEGYAQTDPDRVRKGFVSGVDQDSLYKFQGFIVYQLVSNDVSIDQLNDPTKAKKIYEADINDNVSQVTNWTSTIDNVSGGVYWQPDAVTVPGIPSGALENSGISHSFQDSVDRFGGNALINHKTYYYGVISFATNQFKTFNPATGKGQSVPYLKGVNLNKYSAIPSDPTVENGGRNFNTEWHASSQVKRIEGQGNGGNFIDLTPATIEKILGNNLNYTDTLDYTLGLDPIGLRVTDPLLLKGADFELKIYDSVLYNGNSVSNKAYWILTDLTNNINIHSTRTLDRPYEQIIADQSGDEYGFSITLGTPYPVYTNPVDSMPVYGAIDGASSIAFKDSTKPWLSFVADTTENGSVKNWIRSGGNYVPCGVQAGLAPDPGCNVFSDAYTKLAPNKIQFSDPNNVFDKIAGGRWAPYCLTPNWSRSPLPGGNITFPAASQPGNNRPQTVGGPAFKWDSYADTASPPRNNLDRLQSVDIVITADRSKWSRCVVFETGENPIGGDLDPTGNGVPPRKGMLRSHYSLKKDGTSDNDPQDVGRSYFPGYAVNVETGQRLEVAFGEASDERDFNGTDMIWNPTSQLLGTLDGGGPVPFKPYFAGRHFIYVLDIPYPSRAVADSGGLDIQGILRDFDIYNTMVNNPVRKAYPDTVVQIYDHIMWTAIPYLTPGYSLASLANGIVPDGNDVTIKLRVQKPYAKFATNATPSSGDAFPRYRFSTIGKSMTSNNDSIAKTALDKIRVVPNPYYAYSAYERSANDGRVKVTNLPNICTIKIYTLDGVLVRSLSRSVSGNDPATGKKIEISDGLDLNTDGVNIDNTVDWDLKNETNITVASGIYIFDINAPGIGHKILKWFGAMRPTDVSNF